jgi:hypothetical protein
MLMPSLARDSALTRIFPKMNVKARLVGRGNADRRVVNLVRNARKLAQLLPDLCDRAHGHAQRRD